MYDLSGRWYATSLAPFPEQTERKNPRTQDTYLLESADSVMGLSLQHGTSHALYVKGPWREMVSRSLNLILGGDI